MIANDVYTIAKALSKEEFINLYDMLRSDINQAKIKPNNKNILPDFTMEDGLRFLIKNHITKIKKT